MRYVEITQTALNGVTNANQAIPTPDDNGPRTIKTIWVAPQAAAGLLITLRKTGFQLAQFDSLRCGLGNHPIIINEFFEQTLQFTIDFFNNTGGNLAGVPIMIGYELGNTTGQPISNSVV